MAAVNPGFETTAVTAGDRFTFTVFLAIAVHAAIILGVTFTYSPNLASNQTMEVTLAQRRSNNRPDKADYLAQFNQIGSGTLENKAMTTTPKAAEFHDSVVRDTSPKEQIASAPTQKRDTTVITTTATSQAHTNPTRQVVRPMPVASDRLVQKTLLQRSLEIASLEARLDSQRQLYAKRPRIKRLTSLSTASSVDAYYLFSWRRKIERIGNLNYPAEAKRKQIYGNLRLLVAVLPDGSLKDVKLLQSSGHQVLDDAAIRIVNLAAPFAPFPDDLRRTTDVLEIIRTWQFRMSSSDHSSDDFRTEF